MVEHDKDGDVAGVPVIVIVGAASGPPMVAVSRGALRSAKPNQECEAEPGQRLDDGTAVGAAAVIGTATPALARTACHASRLSILRGSASADPPGLPSCPPLGVSMIAIKRGAQQADSLRLKRPQ